MAGVCDSLWEFSHGFVWALDLFLGSSVRRSGALVRKKNPKPNKNLDHSDTFTGCDAITLLTSTPPLPQLGNTQPVSCELLCWSCVSDFRVEMFGLVPGF